MHGDDLFTVDTEHRRLWAVSLTTGERRVEAEDLAVGLPPGVDRRPDPALFAHGGPGLAPRLAGLAAAPDGSLLLSSNGEGTVLRLSPGRFSGGGPGTACPAVRSGRNPCARRASRRPAG